MEDWQWDFIYGERERAVQHAKRIVVEARENWPRFRELEGAIRRRIQESGDPDMRRAYMEAFIESEPQCALEPTPKFATRVDDEVERIFAKEREAQC